MTVDEATSRFQEIADAYNVLVDPGMLGMNRALQLEYGLPLQTRLSRTEV